MKILKYIALYLAIVITLILIVPNAKPLLKTPETEKNKEEISLLSIGDSLTEGVGDELKNGGYVPYLVKSIEEMSIKINYNNYGKSGDKVEDIIKRIENSEEIKNNLKKADIITLTVGGNDLMKVIKENILKNMTKETFEQPKEEYIENLKELYQLIRKYSDSPIYHLGIYNPFYLTFKEIEEMQEIVDEWNDATISVIKEPIYFIPINDEIYKGQGIEGKDINDLLSKEDSFHPNNIGYQIISREFKIKIEETKAKWLEENKWKNIGNKY